MPRASKAPPATDSGWISTSLTPWLRRERAAISVLAGFAVVFLSVYGWYVGPDRSGASGAIDAMTEALVVVDYEEHLAIAQFTKYLEPGPIFVRQAMKSGDNGAVVLTSFADRNHWFLKVLHTSTRTVCMHLGTISDDGPKNPSCREASATELAAIADARLPAVAVSGAPLTEFRP